MKAKWPVQSGSNDTLKNRFVVDQRFFFFPQVILNRKRKWTQALCSGSGSADGECQPLCLKQGVVLVLIPQCLF